MAYDLHIGTSNNVHDYRYAFEEHCHTSLFSYIKSENLSLPYLNRMADYYKDSKYSGAELLALIKDINILLEMFDNDNVLSSVLQKIKVLANEAANTNSILFGFCD